MNTGNTVDLAALYDRFQGSVLGNDADPALHFFHAPNSICSQKVRTVLHHLNIPHWSHLIDVFHGESYDPLYVRARHAGCKAAGLTLSARHLGTTSVTTSGCDACVVPTVIDRREGTVLVDSLRICLALDAGQGGVLVPEVLLAEIMAELSVVDDLPNYQNLAVHVVSDKAPRNAFAASKVARCDALLAEYGTDPVLREAYEAKKAKEKWAAEELFEEGALQIAREAVTSALDALEERVTGREGPWLFGEQITIADLFWGAELIRIDDLDGADVFTKDRLPAVFAWYERLCALPALKSAILEFPQARIGAKPLAQV
ncbi:MAG: glutathione S-transferase family protein [Rhodobacteraceae bacterium]|nr:glutathione S-transferase family protein [Paracoccaceae bacterium]